MKEYSFCVIFALREEFDTFINCIETPENLDVEYYDSGSKRYYRQDIKIEGLNGFVAVLPDDRMGMTPMSNMIGRIKSKIPNFPNLVINIGIAGSADKSANLGDVLVATETIEYASKGKMKDGEWLPGPSYVKFQDKKSKYFKDYEVENSQEYNRWRESKKQDIESKLDSDELSEIEQEFGDMSLNPSLLTGKLATGPWVNESKDLTDFVKKKIHRKVKAFDMEGATIGRSLPDDVSYVSVRAISDYGPIKYEENIDVPSKSQTEEMPINWREFASKNASEYVCMVLESDSMQEMMN